MSKSAADLRREQRKKELEAKKARLAALKERKTTPQETEPEEAKPNKLDQLKEVTSVESLLQSLSSDIPPAEDPPEITPQPTAAAAQDAPAKEKKDKAPLKLQEKVVDFSVNPKPIITYSKGTQTISLQTDDDDDDDVFAPPKVEEPWEKDESDTSKSSGEGEKKFEQVKTAPEEVELSEAEKEHLLKSKELSQFLDEASRVAERAIFINKKYNVLVNYAPKEEGDTLVVGEGEIALQTKLSDERWTKHRAVSSMSWSTKFPELLLSSYSESTVMSHANDPDGLVLVWSVQNLLDRPEFVFNCQSPVLTAQFSPFQPTIVIGGTYSGQIVLWDSRAKSTPVQRSPLSSTGHTHPIYSLSVVGTKNAHNLVTISTDGTLCAWTLDNLLQPIEQLQLESKASQRSATPAAATCVSFPDNQVNHFYIGTEEGAVYQGQRHGTNQGLTERYQGDLGHTAPITSLDFHSPSGELDFSEYFITSSLDWTCKLWSKKDTSKPLHTFRDSSDCVYDCQWSPAHPALFSTADGSGNLRLWNINADPEVPVVNEHVSNRALNKIRYSGDGKHLVCGDAGGTLYIYDVSSYSNPSTSEWEALDKNLLRLSTQRESFQTAELDL